MAILSRRNNARPPFVIVRRHRSLWHSRPADLEHLGIISGTPDRLRGIVGNQRIIAVRDKSKRDRAEYRLYCEVLPRKSKGSTNLLIGQTVTCVTSVTNVTPVTRVTPCSDGAKRDVT